jgi:hypothetical protein
MEAAAVPETESTATTFSLVRGGPLFALQRRLGLIPAHGLGVARRALTFAALAWVPMMILALWQRRAVGSAIPDPLFYHFDVHARCLVGIPLLIAAENVAERVLPTALADLIHSGTVSGNALPGFAAALHSAEHERDSRVALAVLLGVVTLNAIAGASPELEQVTWATTDVTAKSHLLAGWWHLVVVRPLFSVLIGLWIWRLVVLWVLFRKIARLDLRLVPTHPDRVGGLGALKGVPAIFVPVILGLSIMLAARIGYEVVHHGLGVPPNVFWLLGTYTVSVVAVFQSPLLALAPVLFRLRQTALRDYGMLVGRQGRLVHRRWIRGEPVANTDLFAAPEIGPVADALSMYEAVAAVRVLPLDRQTVALLAIAALIPMLPVIALQVPLKEIALKLAAVLL